MPALMTTAPPPPLRAALDQGAPYEDRIALLAAAATAPLAMSLRWSLIDLAETVERAGLIGVMTMAFGKRVDVPGGRRRIQREPVVLAAGAVMLDRSRSVVVEDVCSSGARLRGRDLPEQGQQLLLKVGPVDFLASVAWVRTEECGITFTPPLEPTGVIQLKEEGKLGRVLGII
jgi:hypothetical protein